MMIPRKLWWILFGISLVAAPIMILLSEKGKF